MTLVVLGRWARLVYRPPALDAPDAPLPRSSPPVRGFFLPHHRVSSFRGLRSGLTPSNLASEAASRVGIADLSWGGAFDYASKRHPVPTAIIGLGVALWTMSAVRNRARRGHVAALTAPLRESSESILESATRVFRERAEAKRREFVDVAQGQVATGAAMLSVEIETRLENVIDRVPGGIKV